MGHPLVPVNALKKKLLHATNGGCFVGQREKVKIFLAEGDIAEGGVVKVFQDVAIDLNLLAVALIGFVR